MKITLIYRTPFDLSFTLVAKSKDIISNDDHFICKGCNKRIERGLMNLSTHHNECEYLILGISQKN
jgi:hypothetical protein